MVSSCGWVIRQRDARGQHAGAHAANPIAVAPHGVHNLLEHRQHRHGRTRAVERRPEHLRQQRSRRLRFKQDRTGVVLRRRRGPQRHQLLPGLLQRLAHLRHGRQVGRARRIRGIKIVHRHAVLGLGFHSRFNGRKGMADANLRALAGQQVFGCINDVVSHSRGIHFAEPAQRRRSLPRFGFPVARSPVGLDPRLHELHCRLLREVVNVRRPRQAVEIGLLARELLDRFLERLIGGDPQVLAQGIVVAVNAHRPGRADESAERVVADEIRAVELVVPHARFHAHEAVAHRRARYNRAEFRHHGAHIQVQQPVFDVVGPHRRACAGDLQFQARFGARHFIPHRFQRVIVIVRRGQRCRERCGKERPGKSERHRGKHAFHCRPPVFTGSCAGGGRMGGLSVFACFF